MKRLLTLLSAIMMAAAIALPSMATSNHLSGAAMPDTLILKLKNNARVLVVVNDLKDLKSIKGQSLDSLVGLLEKHTTEIERAGQAASDSAVTITVSTEKDGSNTEQVNITIAQNGKNGKQVITKTIRNVKIDVEKDEENNKTSIKINSADDDDDDDDDKPRNRKKEFDFQVDLGLDSWMNKKTLASTGVDKINLKPLGSRYISLNAKWNYRLGGERSPLRLNTGFGFEFHNFMFDDNLQMANNGSEIVFTDDVALEKSKLATTSVTVPLELGLNFKNSRGKTNFKIGGGGFVGYLLEGKTKVVQNSATYKVKEDFHMNEFQYGLSGYVGVRSLEFFVKYNLNEMFEDNKGPQANAIAFGVRILKL
ncbi:porin family protein [Rufibacter ruber]|uniref:porin family protein n=1 Tax=Rufibacter ruber TaxID=1783499 RepID=UPI00082F91E4|nr:porin family protein [Rufibacter ruber]